MNKLLLGILIGLGFLASTAYAVTVFNSSQVGSSPTGGYVLQTNGTASTWVATSTLGISGSGSVTSVDMTTPTGLTVSGNPITTSGTLALSLQSGYNIPLTASTTNWNSAYLGSNLIAGSNITINSSTPGQITISATGGGGGGNSAWTIGSGLIYNATSTDLVGIGTVTPTTTLTVQGKGGTNPFLVNSSTGASLLSLTQAGNLTASGVIGGSNLSGTNTGDVTLAGQDYLTLSGQQITAGAVDLSGANATGVLAAGRFPALTGDITTSAGSLATALKNTGSAGSCTYCSATFDAQGRETAQSSGATPNTGSGTTGQVPYFTGANTLASASKFLYDGSVVGYNATSSSISFNIQGTSGSANTIFNVASSSGTSILAVLPNSTVGIGTSSPSATLAVQGASGQAINLLAAASSSNFTMFSVNGNGLVLSQPTATSTQAFVIDNPSGSAITTVDSNLVGDGDVLVVASSTGTTMFSVNARDHISSAGAAPALSSCGTSPSIVGDDISGIVTVGSVSASGCTITFNTAYKNTPACVVQNQTGSITNTFSYTVSNTAIVVTESGLTSDKLNYICHGHAE